MEYFFSLVRLKNTGLVNAGKYQLSVDISFAGVSSEQIVLMSWEREAVTYSVRGQMLPNKTDIESTDSTDPVSSIFQVDYDMEVVHLSDSFLFHANVSGFELFYACEHSNCIATFNLLLQHDTLEWKPISSPVVLELTGDRFGLMNECALLFFSSHDYGSATLELSVFSAALVKFIPAHSVYSHTELENDDREKDLPKRRQMKRRLLQFMSPYACSLMRLQHFLHPYAVVDTSLKVEMDSSKEEDMSVRELCDLTEIQDLEEFAPMRTLLWHEVHQMFSLHRASLFALAREKWLQKSHDLVGELFVREKLSSKLLLVPQDAFTRSKQYRQIAEKLRKAPRFSDFQEEQQPFSGKGTFVDLSGRPVVFEQRFEHETVLPPKSEEVDSLHLVVLVHGFLGSRWDLKVFQQVFLSLEIPNTRCRAMACNENHTEWPLADQGTKLASEILDFSQGKTVSRLSFVAYSMGAVVARVALNDARIQEMFHDKLHTFVSVAGPHLGSGGSDSALVGIGQWAITRWKRIDSLSQLALEDSFMENLAVDSDMLGKFRTVALVSSSTDTYVPSYSARVELPQTGASAKVGRMQRALSANLMRVPTLSKIELDFSFNTQSRTTKERFEVMLGRTAHVHVLDSIPLTLTLCLIFGKEWFY